MGFFAQVVDGPQKGRYGVLQSIGDLHEDGSPKTAVLRTRDGEDDYLNVNYEQLRPDVAGRR